MSVTAVMEAAVLCCQMGVKGQSMLDLIPAPTPCCLPSCVASPHKSCLALALAPPPHTHTHAHTTVSRALSPLLAPAQLCTPSRAHRLGPGRPQRGVVPTVLRTLRCRESHW